LMVIILVQVSARTTCEDYCSRGVYHYDGVYNERTGECEYSQMTCKYGCNEEGSRCADRVEETRMPSDESIERETPAETEADEQTVDSSRVTPDSADTDCPEYCENSIHYFSGKYNSRTLQCEYENRTCKYGCDREGKKCAELGAEEAEEEVSCPNYCQNGLLYYRGVYNERTGECEYNYRMVCEYGCNEEGTACASQEGFAGCKDSDGRDIYTKGSTTGWNYDKTEIVTSHDYCTDSDGGAELPGGKWVAEEQCDEEGRVHTYYYKCPTDYWCSDGRCVYRQEVEEEEVGQVLIEASKDRGERKIRVAYEDGQEAEIELKTKGADIEFSGSTLIIKKANKEFLVEQRFDYLLSKFVTRQEKVKRIDISVEDDKAVYDIKTSRQGRLFWFIPVTIEVTKRVDAESFEKIEETKPWWSIFVIETVSESNPQPSPSPKKEETDVSGECEVDRESKDKELLCPEGEPQEIGEYPTLEGTLIETSGEITKLDLSDSNVCDSSECKEFKIIENNPELINLDFVIKNPRPPNAKEYPKISPTLLAMYNFVTNDCLNNPENDLCPPDRSYYYEKIDNNTPVEIKLELTTTHSNIKKSFVDMGGEVIYFNPEKDILVGEIGIARLIDLHEREDVSYISRFVPESEFWDLDDDATDFVQLDHLYDVGQEGEGVKIAVLDSGFKDYLNSQANGNLPAGNKLHYKNFLDTPDITKDHGRKCAEVVHAVAPKAELYLYRVSGHEAWEDAVDEAIDEGVDIITSSIGYHMYGPGTGKGLLDDVVKKATDNGILWFQANGNEHHKFFHTHYSNPGDKWVNLMPGDETNHYDLFKDQKLKVQMRYDQWGADGHGDAKDDFDLYVVKKNANVWEIIASSIDDNIETGIPFEILEFTAPEDGRYHIAIYEYEKNTAGDVVFSLHYSRKHPEYESDGKEVVIPADSPEAISVGAVHEGGVLAGYTSRGPTIDGRFKPDFAAPSGFVLPAGNEIAGTSFSTPFLAGSAAVLGKINFRNHAEIYKILKYMTFYEDKVMDNEMGWGIPNFDHTFNKVTCVGSFTKGGPYRVYCDGYPVYLRKTAYASLQLVPNTFFWNGAAHESKYLTLTDNTKLLLEYPKWHGLFLDTTGKGQPKVFDIKPQEGDSEVHFIVEESGVVKTGLYKKEGKSGKQKLMLSIKSN